MSPPKVTDLIKHYQVLVNRNERTRKAQKARETRPKYCIAGKPTVPRPKSPRSPRRNMPFNHAKASKRRNEYNRMKKMTANVYDLLYRLDVAQRELNKIKSRK